MKGIEELITKQEGPRSQLLKSRKLPRAVTPKARHFDSRRSFSRQLAGALVREKMDDWPEFVDTVMARCAPSPVLVASFLSHIPSISLMRLAKKHPATQKFLEQPIGRHVMNLSIFEEEANLSNFVTHRVPYSSLTVSVYDNLDLFIPRGLTSSEKEFPIILPEKEKGGVLPAFSCSVVPTMKEFEQNLQHFSGLDLRRLDWSNLFLGNYFSLLFETVD